MNTLSFPPDPIFHLWREARAFLAGMLADFISPAYVARAVAARARAAFRKRLQLLESLVMKLLLIEASRVHPAPHRRNSSAARGAKPEAAGFHRFPGRGAAAGPGPMNTGHAGEITTSVAPPTRQPAFSGPGLGAARQSGNRWAEHHDHPITWRVRFHTPVPRRRQSTPTPRHRAKAAPPCAQTLALRLARRFEALRRVIADPRAAIAALARKLHALGAAAYAIARRIALWRPRTALLSLAHGHATVCAHDASLRWRSYS